MGMETGLLYLQDYLNAAAEHYCDQNQVLALV